MQAAILKAVLAMECAFKRDAILQAVILMAVLVMECVFKMEGSRKVAILMEVLTMGSVFKADDSPKTVRSKNQGLGIRAISFYTGSMRSRIIFL